MVHYPTEMIRDRAFHRKDYDTKEVLYITMFEECKQKCTILATKCDVPRERVMPWRSPFVAESRSWSGADPRVSC